MKIKQLFKKLMGGVKFSISSLLFFIVGVVFSLLLYNSYAYVAPDSAGTTLSSTSWNKFVTNDQDFQNRINTLETAVSTTLPNAISTAQTTANNASVGCGWTGMWSFADAMDWGNDFAVICIGGKITRWCTGGWTIWGNEPGITTC
jgi:hypothetical protein